MDQTDRLADMMAMQRKLQERMPIPDLAAMRGAKPFSELDADTRAMFTKWHKEQALALMMEAGELMDWMPWKHWSSRLGNKVDVEPFSDVHVHEIQVEIADCLHFVFNLALMWGMDSAALYRAFADKMGVNHQRREDKNY